jgi:hypothetical protein
MLVQVIIFFTDTLQKTFQKFHNINLRTFKKFSFEAVSSDVADWNIKFYNLEQTIEKLCLRGYICLIK